MFLFANDMILYIKDPKHSRKTLLDTIYCFCKVAEYKINLQISRLSIHQQWTDWEKNIGKQFHVPKDVNDLYRENYKPLKKEIEED
jgi:hypothetical protein